jgi:lipopolysaccharide transport protein LptA
MKKFFLPFLFLIAAAPAPAAEPGKRAGATNEMVIECDNGFEYLAPKAIYQGNVRVTDPQMKLTCELMTVFFQTNSGRIDTIIAENNVAIRQQDTVATGERAVYTATNDIVTLSGNAVLDTPQGLLRGALIILDRKNNKLYAPGKVFMEGKPGAGLFGTNSLGITLPGPKPAATNAPAAPPPNKK